MSDHDRLIEIMARAMINKRRESIKSLMSMDSYEVLRSWAFPDQNPKIGTLGYRSHPDNFADARREWDDLHAEAVAVVTAIEADGFLIVAPGDGAMTDIVERLRRAQLNHDELRFGWLAEAADEISQLREALAGLTDAVETVHANQERIVVDPHDITAAKKVLSP